MLHASEVETFSIVVAEAIATGTPVLASNVGALSELINESNGILVNNTLNEWVDGLIKLTNTNFDNEQVSRNGAKRFDITEVGTAFNTVYGLA